MTIVPKINFNHIRKTLFLVFIAVSIFGGGYYLGLNAYIIDFQRYPKVNISRELPVDKRTIDFSLFWRVWDTLNANYFDKSRIKPASMVYGAISGMVAAVGDPYTVFLAPSENKVVNEDLNGSFEG